MQVTAFSNPRHPEWRWRITNYAGEMIEESRDEFLSIAEAVAAGTERLLNMNVIDRSDAVRRSFRPGRRPNRPSGS